MKSLPNSQLTFRWPQSGFSDYSLNIYINNNLVDSRIVNKNEYTVENLSPGDCAQISVRGYKNQRKLAIIHHTELQCTASHASTEPAVPSCFECNNKTYDFQKINNTTYSGSIYITEPQNFISIYGKNIDSDIIDYSIYFTKEIISKSNSCEDILIEGSKNNVPLSGEFNFLNSRAIIHFQTKPVTVNGLNVTWSSLDEHYSYAYITPKMSELNVPFVCEIFEDKHLSRLLNHQISINNACKIKLNKNQRYYLKIKPQPWHNQYEEYVYKQPLFQYIPKTNARNENKINTFKVSDLSYGELQFDCSMHIENDLSSHFELLITSKNTKGDILNQEKTSNNLTATYSYVDNIHEDQNIIAELSLYDSINNQLLDQKIIKKFIPRPSVHNARITFNYHEGFNQLHFDYSPIFDVNDVFSVYYSGHMDDDYTEYSGESITRKDKEANYHIKIESKKTNSIISNKYIHSKALEASIMVTNKSSAYFPNQALFNVANSRRNTDNISKIEMYRGPVCEFVSGSHPQSKATMDHMFNIKPSSDTFYKDIGIGNLIDYPDKSTTPDKLYNENYLFKDNLETISYYSGQNYQSILIPVNGFGSGSPCILNYELGINNPKTD